MVVMQINVMDRSFIMKSDSQFGVERKGKEIGKAQLADHEKSE